MILAYTSLFTRVRFRQKLHRNRILPFIATTVYFCISQYQPSSSKKVTGVLQLSKPIMMLLTTVGLPTIGTAAFVSVLLLIWTFLLRPRRGSSKDAPPLVVVAKNNIPFIGILIEFFSSPNNMVQRCAKDYGSVFTIPVRFFVLFTSYDMYHLATLPGTHI
jgi:hypothetical protein